MSVLGAARAIAGRAHQRRSVLPHRSRLHRPPARDGALASRTAVSPRRAASTPRARRARRRVPRPARRRRARVRILERTGPHSRGRRAGSRAVARTESCVGRNVTIARGATLTCTGVLAELGEGITIGDRSRGRRGLVPRRTGRTFASVATSSWARACESSPRITITTPSTSRSANRARRAPRSRSKTIVGSAAASRSSPA